MHIHAVLVYRLQKSCNKVGVKPISGCVPLLAHSCESLEQLVSPCYKVYDGNRLATSCSWLFVTSCYELVVMHQLVKQLVTCRRYQTRWKNNCCEAVGLINLIDENVHIQVIPYPYSNEL